MSLRAKLGLICSLGIVALVAAAIFGWGYLRDWIVANLPPSEPSEVASLAVSPDGAFVVAGHKNGVLSVWDPFTTANTVLKGLNRRGLEAVAISHDLRYIASGSRWYDQRGGTIQVYDRMLSRWIMSREDGSYSPALAFHPSKAILAYATSDDSISLFDVGLGREVKRLASKRLRPSALAFTPDGNRLAVAPLETKEFHQHSVALWEIDGDSKAAEFTGLGIWAKEVGFSSEGEWLGAIGLGDELIVWEVKSGRLAKRFPPQPWRPSSLSFAPDGASVFMCSGEETITEQPLKEGALKKEWTPPPRPGKKAQALFVRCDPKGRYVACGMRNRVVFMSRQRP
jgi:WD40 repeat protein